MLAVGSRVVARTRLEAALCGVVLAQEMGKLLGMRLHVRFDDGTDGWFGRDDGSLLEEGSPEADALLQAYAESLGAPDLDDDIAFSKNNPDQRRRAVDRLVRHTDPRATQALLERAVGERSDWAYKAPHFVPRILRALTRIEGDPVPTIIEHLRRWYATPELRSMCGWVARAFETAPDPRLLEVYRELCAVELDPTLLRARLRADDPTVYEDLAQTRIAARDGRLALDVGGLSPEAATKVIAAAGERAEALEQLNLVAQGGVAFGAIDLAAWLSWPDLRRFRRLNLSEGFTGKKGVELLMRAEHLGDVVWLDLTACDIGSGGCGLLGKAKNLGALKTLVLDGGDYDKSKWNDRALERLFPKKGGTLRSLEHLSIRQWDVDGVTARRVLTPERAPALRTVDLSRETVEL